MIVPNVSSHDFSEQQKSNINISQFIKFCILLHGTMVATNMRRKCSMSSEGIGTVW